MTPRLLDAGDGAVTIEFGDQITSQLVGRVAALDKLLQAARERGELAGVVETMPTFRSLTVFFDPLLTSRAALLDALQPLHEADAGAAPPPGRQWQQWIASISSCKGNRHMAHGPGVALIRS